MKFLSVAKDGGPASTVTGYWFVEIRKLFSVVSLRFDDGSRDEYHSHAFDSLNWVLRGEVEEQGLFDSFVRRYLPSIVPVLTRRDRFHRVVSRGTTWVLSLRGPWSETWHEYSPALDKFTELGHGRVEVG